MIKGLLVFVGAHFRQAWRRRIIANLFILTALSLSFLVLDFGFLISKNFRQMTQGWGKKIEMNVYLNEGAEVAKVKEKLDQHPMVESIRVVSQVEAIRELEGQLGSVGKQLLTDQDLAKLIPASLQLELKAEKFGKARVRDFADALKQNQMVEDVQYGMGLMEQFQTILNVISRVGYLALVAVFAGALFIVSFVIRSSISKRRDEIEILELVGASRSMIRTPIILEGIFFSIFSGVFSLILCRLGFIELKGHLKSEEIFSYIADELVFFTPNQMAVMLAAFCLVGGVASLICIRQMNSGFSAASRLEVGTE